MTPTGVIAIVNQSKLVTDEECLLMMRSISEQLANDVRPIWGQVPAMAFVPTGGSVMAGETPCYIQDEPDVDGALGYHDEDANGVPYIKVFAAPTLSNGGRVLAGADAVSVTLSHEVIELVGDGPANMWADGPDGADYARELCDAVEGDTYEVNGVSVSNFLYPAFFDPKASKGSKFDFLEKLEAPFGMTPGGYQIKRTEPGRVTQVFAAGHIHQVSDRVVVVYGPSFPAWKKPYKLRKVRQRCGKASVKHS